MNELERIRDQVGHLVTGWHEHLDYAVVIGGSTERRGRTAYQPALIAQLRDAGCEGGGIAQGGGTPYNKPGSRPPGNTAGLHLLDWIECCAWDWYRALWTEARVGRLRTQGSVPLAVILVEVVDIAGTITETHPWLIRRLGRDVASWVRRARIVLGYDKPEIQLKDAVCGECGGTLLVASDAGSDVRCNGTEESPPCGVTYPRYRWIEMMA